MFYPKWLLKSLMSVPNTGLPTWPVAYLSYVERTCPIGAPKEGSEGCEAK
jgi:hypothetical protein